MMTKSKFLASLSLAITILAGFTACDDTTDTIGTTLADATAGVQVETATFTVLSQSLQVDSVLSRNTNGYIGRVKDPETGAYITADFMAQLNNIEDFQFPDLEDMVTLDDDGNEVYGTGTIFADSCTLYAFVSDIYGDSTQTMKATAYEMAKPMNEDRLYYSNFDPMEEGYVADDAYSVDKAYNLVDYNVSESERDTSTYMPYITFKLNKPYTSREGKTYDSYGTYILQMYYDDPSNYKNAYTFRNKVTPGFYFKFKNGLGNMATIQAIRLDVSFRYKSEYEYTETDDDGNETTLTADSLVCATGVFWSTEEVLQTANFTNDTEAIKELAADQTCTYLKTPAGIFTEMTLPVDDIMQGHENDTIASARLEIPRINNTVQSEYALDVPSTVLMVPKDSIFSFFENENLYDNKTSYVTSWGYSTSSTDNTYTFGNIGGLITAMYDSKAAGNTSEDWNKVVLIPVTLETTTASSSYYSSSSTVVKVCNDMSLTSTKLVKGTDAGELQLSVIYSKFK